MFKFPSYAIVISSGALAMFALASTAQAAPVSGQTTYVFDQDFCSTSCLNGASGGTITLSSPATNEVTVAVSLSGVAFHDNFESFTFNLTDPDPTISLVGSITGDNASANWTLANTTGNSFMQDGAGIFDYAVNCSNCAPSNGSVTDTSVTFTIMATGLTVNSFQELSDKNGNNGENAGPSYFSAAAFNTLNTSCTGVIGASGASSGTTSTGSGSACATVPAPPIGQGLPVALAVGGLLLGFKLWERSRKRRSPETAIPYAAA